MFSAETAVGHAHTMRFFDADFKKFTNVDLPVPAGPNINRLELVRSIVLNAAICVSFKIGISGAMDNIVAYFFRLCNWQFNIYWLIFLGICCSFMCVKSLCLMTMVYNKSSFYVTAVENTDVKIQTFDDINNNTTVTACFFNVA